MDAYSIIFMSFEQKNVQSIAKESSIKLNIMLMGAGINVITDANIYEDLVKENYSNTGKEENYEHFLQDFQNYK